MMSREWAILRVGFYHPRVVQKKDRSAIRTRSFPRESKAMTANQRVKEQIKEKIEHIPVERLTDVLALLLKIEKEEQHVLEILSFAGSWKAFDQEWLDELTVGLHKHRMLADREMNVE